MLITESVDQQLDDLLERVGAKLQLSPAAYEQAEARYTTIGEWLNDEKSILAPYKPVIYPQGSARIGTTVKPRARQEHDIDLVCELEVNWNLFPEPVRLLDMVEFRLKEHETYRKMIERKNRCMRIVYANLFHLDILPACPNPSVGPHCVKVPDRAARAWKDSNPRGYARWFEATAERRVAEFKKHVEPLPVQVAVADMAPLKRAVQLIKRNRDVVFEKTPELAPVSVALTTLAAQHYAGQQSVNAALMGILNAVVASVKAVPYGERLYVLNPTNPLEDLSERWTSEPGAYRAFVDAVTEFRDRWAEVNEMRGMHRISSAMEKLFGENLAKEVVAEHVKSLEASRHSGGLAVKRGSGTLTGAGSSGAVSVAHNNFYGG
jgi:hypothetical protein